MTKVVARAGPLYGEALFDPEATLDVLRVEVAPDHTLHVQVIDATGAPCDGVEVWACSERSGRAPGKSRLGVTRGERGILTVPHLQLRDFGAGPGEAATSRIGVFARVLGVPPVPRFFDRNEPPAEPVVLRLPPCGRVVVKTRSPDGRPRSPAGFVTLTQLGGGVDPVLPWTREVSLYGQDGVTDVVFGYVALGLQLRATAQGSGLRFGPVEVAGPTTQRPEVEVVLQPSAATPILRLQATDEECKPLVGQMLQLEFLSGGQKHAAFRTRSDQSGLCDSELPLAWLGGRVASLLLTHYDDTGPTGRLARLPLDVSLSAGLHDLGPVVLAEAPRIVAGAIVDENGVPILQAGLVLLARQTTGAFAKASFAHVLRQDSGRFELRGAAPPGADLAVEVSSAEHIARPPIAFAPGTADLRIVLQRKAPLTAAARWSAGITSAR